MNEIEKIFHSWSNGRNALLYGPPATGKTRLISELYEALLEPPSSSTGILLDPQRGSRPFSRPKLDLPIPQPVKVVWTTFHQSYGYEDFVLGLKPEINGSTTRLAPVAGVLLDSVLELRDPDSPYQSVVIFIDEINRGNAARIFGEFMTFLDFDYREGGKVPLPVPLRQLSYSNGESEPIARIGGSYGSLPETMPFPKDIYLVATMNSVDRAAVPIDSALARRFDRIEMRPDLSVLASHWGIDIQRLSLVSQETLASLGPHETAYLMLDRINATIASDLGPEFELGHGLLMQVKALPSGTAASGSNVEDQCWLQLARIWDDILYPQLEDRFAGRADKMIELLRVDAPPREGEYAWRYRRLLPGSTSYLSIEPISLSSLPIDVIRRSLRWLTL